MIAVMGAAGNVGRRVVDRLLLAGEEVRALEHARGLTTLGARGAHIVKGDARNAEDLRALFSGASVAFVLLPENVADPSFADPSFVENRVVMSRTIRDAMRVEGVSHVVALSAVGAALADAPGPLGGLHTFEQDLAELEANVLVPLNEGVYFEGVARTAEATTPTRLEDFLDQALSEAAMTKGGARR